MWSEVERVLLPAAGLRWRFCLWSAARRLRPRGLKINAFEHFLLTGDGGYLLVV